MRNKARRLNLHGEQSGDTLISIILSVAVISLVIVISYILISNSLRLSQQAREREQVRNVLRGQVEGLKYLAFNDGDGYVFSIFNQNGLTAESEPFCLVDHEAVATPGSPTLQISALQLDGPAGSPDGVDQTANNLRPDGWNPMDPARPDCVGFSSLDAADVKIWIIYDPEGAGDPSTPGDEEHLFTIMAEWDGIRGGTEEMIMALRLPPPNIP